MDFSETAEQRMLRETTRRLLESRSSLTEVRALSDRAEGHDTAVWRQGAELGWPALAVPEDAGGLGQGIADLALVAEEHGRLLYPGPFVPTVLVAGALAASPSEPLRDEVLPDLLDGGATAGWASAEPGRPWTPAAVRAEARAGGDGYALTGTKRPVQLTGDARWLLVTALLDGSPAAFLVDVAAAGLQVTPLRTLDVTRRFVEVTLDGVQVPRESLVSRSAEDIQRWLDVGAVLTAAETVGIAHRVLAMTVEYASVRVQFGRPIGSFQAVKHKCADMMQWAQGSRVATYYAAMAIDASAPDARRAASVAKAYTSEHVSRLVGEALQTHGGIGFTWEHDLHLYIRRTKVNEVLFGDPATHQDLLCADLVAEHRERTPA